MSACKFLFPAICAVLINGLATAQDCKSLTGIWINDGESVLTIDSISQHSEVFGTYRSSTGTDGKSYPVIGWVNNYINRNDGPTAVSFSVRWEGYGSITSWTGTCENKDDQPRLLMMWHLVRPQQEYPWERIITNFSTFQPDDSTVHPDDR